MTLRTVQVPDPAPGRDWATTVPGNFIYNVTGITGTLETASVPNQLTDASGNTNNGTYTHTGTFGLFSTGIVTGDDAWYPNLFNNVDPADGATIPHGLADWLNPFTLVWWQRIEVAEAGGGVDWIASFDAGMSAQFNIIEAPDVSGAGFAHFTFNAFPNFWATDNTCFNADGVDHMAAVVWDGAILTLYEDGVVVPWVLTGAPPGTPTAAASTNLGNAAVGVGTWDELAIFPAALSAGDITTLYAAGRAGFAVWVPAVDALAPTAFYHLDGAASSAGRDVILVVATPEATIQAIPTGFGPSTAAGPFSYSWQPDMPASTETPDGKITTVGIPHLALQPGYSVGTFTVDIQPADQWRNVVLWWNDDLMNTAQNTHEYLYPPGAHYIYRQRTTTP